jgi:hypothetical protein
LFNFRHSIYLLVVLFRPGRPVGRRSGYLFSHPSFAPLYAVSAPGFQPWPSYQSLYDKYGDYHAQCFPLPNARSLLGGSEYYLWVDDGLGGYLAQIGLAAPFLAWAEWDEEIPIPIR